MGVAVGPVADALALGDALTRGDDVADGAPGVDDAVVSPPPHAVASARTTTRAALRSIRNTSVLTGQRSPSHPVPRTCRRSHSRHPACRPSGHPPNGE